MRNCVLALVVCVFAVVLIGQPASAESCREMYHDKAFKDARNELASRAGSLGLAAVTVTASLVTTIFTLGAASPLFIISVCGAAGKICYDGYKIQNPFQQYCIDSDATNLLEQADETTQGKTPKNFAEFVHVHFPNSSTTDVAQALLKLDANGKACDILNFQDEKYIQFIQLDEVVKRVGVELGIAPPFPVDQGGAVTTNSTSTTSPAENADAINGTCPAL